MALLSSWQAHSRVWIAGIVALGLGLNVFHYGRAPSVWHDEAALIVNVLEKDFGELTGTLYWAEAAPPLFLWVERAISLLLGDGIYVLRLVPLLASCLSLLLFQALARHLLPPVSAVCAVLLFATSDRLLWHACEAKPYALDVLLATVVLYLHVKTREGSLGRRLCLHVLLAPVLIFLSYPGAFLCGTSLLVMLPVVWRERRLGAWLGYGFWVVCVFGAFALLVLGPARAQRCPEMEACWAGHFPDWSRPWRVPIWLVASSLEVCRYCFRPLGTGLALLGVVGGVSWWWQGLRGLVLLLTAPLGLALLAACLHRYPYGASRLEVFATPALALLLGAGLLPVLDWLRARERWAPRVVLILLAMGPLLSLYRVAIPWPRQDCDRAAAYVLAHREPEDGVVFNKWEYVYYFRNLGAPFRLLGDRTLPQPRCCRMMEHLDRLPIATRCWVIFSDDSPLSRDCLTTAKWYVSCRRLDQVEFRGTTVYLVAVPERERPSADYTAARP